MKLILAPIRGVTDALFRTLFTQHFGGFDQAVAPFVSTVKGRGVAASHVRDLQPHGNRGLPVVPQVIGNSADDLVNTANGLFAMGYGEVNWNLGCPFVKVTRKRRGSGLLPHPDLVVAILEAALPRLAGRLSLKMRLGLASAEETARLLPRLECFPLASVTIHARTGSQQYEGSVDLDAFERCLGLTRHPVVYNGDITSAARLRVLQERFGDRVAAWMIGRGAVADPFLPAELKGSPRPDHASAIGRLRAFHGELFAASAQRFHGSGALLGRMKELWHYLGNGFAQEGRLVKRLLRATSTGSYQSQAEELLSGRHAWVPPGEAGP